MLPPRGNTPTKYLQERARQQAVTTTLQEVPYRGTTWAALGRGVTPATPHVNGIYMRDDSFKEWLRYGQNYGTDAPLR